MLLWLGLLACFTCPVDIEVYEFSFTQSELDGTVGGTNVDPLTVDCEVLCDDITLDPPDCRFITPNDDAVVAVECSYEVINECG